MNVRCSGWCLICCFVLATIIFCLRFEERNRGWLKHWQIIKIIDSVNRQSNPMIEKGFVTLQKKSRHLILVYTKFSSTEKWINEKKICYIVKHRIPKQCPIDRFELTYDKQRFTQSDFVVFHARDMPTSSHLKTLIKERHFSQRWVFALWESPNHFSDTKSLNGLFNLTWTYRRDSDIWAPYGSYTQLSEDSMDGNGKKRPVSDFARGKSKLVAWMVSNCRPRLRLKFVHELKQFIKVDVYGYCSRRIFGKSRSCRRTKQSNLDCLKKYKFYLSFENALCEDYITEKYWGKLGDANVVPVVMGGADYTKLAIPGSYINVMDFKTVKQLAEYLQYLDKNDTAYNEYFKWRQKYKVLSGIGRTMCNICQWFLSNFSHGTKIYDDLTEFWVKKAKCGAKNHLVLRMLSNQHI